MKKTLILKSTITGDLSHSNKLVDLFLSKWLEHSSPETITERDIIKSPLSVVDDEIYQAYYSVQPEHMTDKQRNAISLSNTLIQEIKDNDIIVITAPMYNFSIPNQLKNYFDLIIRNGLTFSYTKTGKTGLITNKKALILSTSGGIYTTGENDFSIPYLKTLLAFIGINSVDTVTIDGIAIEPEKLEEKYQLAKMDINDFLNNLNS
ncbi:FMN-dependent NADH-azoreductase [Proteus sp. GOKU]|uniref:FMN-dependent NADH-azoreductase n=1 Tax=Proteus TaxID=583 RepID=UPI0018929E11|nr:MULTISPECIES: NAD(P)H-dependent oxidoreductase [Proteus]QPB78957.1 FMN-dependent NADH-azoreductase [Proteus sp. GOKU]QQP24964.1 FMN-dependent NADH-azoreductase [Proteus vulgaris]WPD00198.1 NAD(P)H-dependent oxidoreductase [Proteus terrae]